MFVKQQRPLLLPPIIHVVENLIGLKVFVPSSVAILTGLKIDYTPILNWLWLDSKQKSSHMYNSQQPVLVIVALGI
jgi:hypothetical protein